MRRIIYTLVAAIFVLSSCVQNDPYVPQKGSELSGTLFINEVNGTGGEAGADAEKYVEFYNSSESDISLANFVLEYGGKTTWTGLSGDVVPAGGYFLIKGAKTTYPGMSQGLSSRNANVNLTLLDAEGNTVDYYEKVAELIGKPLELMDHMRIPDGGKWYFVEISAQSPDASNLSNAGDPAVKGEMPSMEKKLQIESVEVTPTKPTPEDDAIFVVKASDVSGTPSVILQYTLNDNQQIIESDMTLNADGLYEGTIGKQPDGTTAKWAVIATNAQGATAQQTGTITWAVSTADYSKLKINEVNGVGKWFEIYNTGDVAINLDGVTAYYSNKDPEDYKVTWTGNATITIPAKGFYTTPIDDGGATLGTDLSANNGNVKLQLRTPDGTVLDTYEKLIDINEGYDDIKNNDHARIPDGTGSWYYNPNAAGTPGATNGTSTTGLTQFGAENGAVVPDYTKLVLNEIDGINKTIELYNNGTVALPLEGVKITKLADDVSDWWTGTVAAGSIPAGGYIVLSNTIDATDPFFGDGGISPKKSVQFNLLAPNGNQIDTFLRGDASVLDSSISDVSPNSYQRIPNGTGDWKMAEPTNGVTNSTTGATIPQD